MAKLYFSYAAMNAGKSTLLLQAAHNYQERGMRVLLMTSAHYGEAGEGTIVSRIGIEERASLYDGQLDLFKFIERDVQAGPLAAVFVDEAQFLTRDQVWQLARVADRLNVPVLTYGLRTDFKGELFEGSAMLLAIADNLREVRTICACGRKATMVVRMDGAGRALKEGEQVSIGKQTYVSLCRRHWDEKMNGVSSN